jgi:membrane protein
VRALLNDRGRGAGGWLLRRPRWWNVAVQVTRQLGEHNAALLAGGVAMYGLLSVFPGLAALVSLYGLFATPSDVIKHMSVFAGVLPPGVWDIFNAQLRNVVARDHGTLTAAAAVGVLIALWSARATMSALMTTTTIAYQQPEGRGWMAQILISLLLTLGVIVGFLLMLLLGVVVPLALEVLGPTAAVRDTVAVLQWLLLWVFAVLGLSVVYHFAPARKPQTWRWVTWGSVLAATCWLVVSGLFSLYVRTFASYGKTYGALGGVVVLLMWFYLLSFIVIIGAELNAVIDRMRQPLAREPR